MTPYDWRLNDIERTANEAKNRLHEVDSLRGDVGRLEHSLRETRTEVDGLRAELQAAQSAISELAQTMHDYIASSTTEGGR